MKKLARLFTDKPGYMKCGNLKIARLTGLKESTIIRYKNSAEYQESKRNYLNSIKTK